MLKKTGVLLLIFLILIISLVSADVEYTEAGEADNFYIRGNGIFNEQLDPADVLISTAVIADPKKVPLVNDLDGDGVQEIIILNGRSINIFQNKSLDIAGSLTLDVPSNERFSNIITFDIDGDSLIEIILVAENNNTLHIIDYNRSTFTENIILIDPVTAHTTGIDAGLVTIGCESVNRCLMAYSDEQDTGFAGSADSTNLYASFFNSTDIANEIILDSSVSFSAHCPPTIRTMSKADYDLDGDVEFIFTYAEDNIATGDAGDDIHILWVNIESNQTVTEEIQVFTTEIGEIVANSNSAVDYKCDNENGNAEFRSGGGFGTALAGKFFTSPLVYDADPLTTGLETIIGAMVDNNEFIIIMYDSTGTKIREFPLIQESEGQIVSNLFRAEIFDDSTSEQDFCIFSQQSTDDQLSLTCGSLQDSDGFGLGNLQTIEFRGDGLAIFNVSHGFDEWNIIVHSGEHDASNSESEIITTFGTLEAEINVGVLSSCFLTNNCDLNLLFRTPQPDGTVVPVDLDGSDSNNLEDLLVLTDSNLFYLDDAFENQDVNAFCGEPGSVDGTCSEFTTNPCLESVWKINTSVEITITAKDPESDLVQVSVTLYDGDSNELTLTSGNISSGTTAPFSFEANKTISAGTLTLTAVDIIENPDDIKTVTKTFSVGPNGVEFNDCTTSVTTGVLGVEAEPEPEDLILTTETGNAIESGFLTVANFTGVSVFIMWLIFMAIVAVAIFQGNTIFNRERGREDEGHKLGIIIIAEILMLVVGTLLGFIPIGIVITIVVLGLIAVGLFFSRIMTGNNSRS
ncbi:hypothetical protein LCGC14_1065180 [marine sediment metagenome]|uniref:Uncharacterized protein n=1 Tax=marine sediment metagenome TaxID=412755 RepID=A0A0F9Q2V4_9ZZZZ